MARPARSGPLLNAVASAPSLVPPHDLEAEEAVLGAMLLDRKAIRHALDTLQPEAFYKPEHELIFGTIRSMYATGRFAEDGRPDATLVAAELGTSLSAAGGSAYLHTLIGSCTTPANVAHYADIVRKHSITRAELRAVEAYKEAIADGTERAEARVRLERALELVGIGAEELLTPFDWQADEEASVEYLLEPDLPRGARVLVFGATEAGKSLWALIVAVEQTRQGRTVAYFSAENPRAVDRARLRKLGVDSERLRFFADPGLDLVDPAHVAALIEGSRGADLIVLDTLSALWSGDESDNAEFIAFDRDVLQRIVRETSACLLLLDHTGHQQAFVSRKGTSAGRGASAKAQKADVAMHFDKRDDGFTILGGKHYKNRFLAGEKPADRSYRFVDEEELGIVLEATEEDPNERVRECADAAVELICAAEDGLTNKKLETALRTSSSSGKGFGTATIAAAKKELEKEQPPRVAAKPEPVSTEGGTQKAKVWRPAPRPDEQLVPL